MLKYRDKIKKELINNKFKITNGLASISLFTLTIFVFGIAQIYYTNVDEFSFTFVDIAPFFLIFSFTFIIVLALAFFLLPNTISEIAITVVFVIAVLLWIQGNFLVWNYGLMNGKDINWSNYIIEGIIDCIVWSAAITISLFIVKKIYKYIVRVSIIIIIIQLLTMSINIYASTKSFNYQESLLNQRNQFTFSSNKNVIIILLDNFKTTVFQEIIDKDNKFKDYFYGFTYYRNSVGGYPATYLNPALIMTGKYYDNSVPIQDFIKNEFNSNSLPKILKNNGFMVNIHTIIPKSIYINEDIVDNCAKRLLHDVQPTDIGYIADVSLFRHTPQIVKRYVYNNQKWFLRQFSNAFTKNNRKAIFSPKELSLNDITFINQMINEANVGVTKNVFKFYHLVGVHPPLKMNKKLNYEDLEYNNQNYTRTAKGSLEIVNMFLQKLKAMGIYDNSMVFIISDHGVSDLELHYNSNGTSDEKSRNDFMSQRVKASALPLVLVKPFDSKGTLKISDAPVSNSDIAQTVISELKINGQFPGKSVFNIKESEERTRRYFYHDLYVPIKPNEKLPQLIEYRINGFSWLNDSWLPYCNEKYKYDTVISFGALGNSIHYQSFGWGKAEEGYTITEGDSASLVIPVKKAEADMSLMVNLEPVLLSEEIKYQRVGVRINETKLGEWSAESAGEYRMTIPKEYLQESPLKVTFELPDAISRKELGIHEDDRVLALMMKSVIIGKEEKYSYGKPIEFGEKGGYKKYLQGFGWGKAEGEYTLTEGKSASLVIPINKAEADMSLKVNLEPVLLSGEIKQQRVVISINGTKLGEWVAASKGEYRMTLSKKYLQKSPLKVMFELPDAISRKELGIHEDDRVLSLMMKSVIIGNGE